MALGLGSHQFSSFMRRRGSIRLDRILIRMRDLGSRQCPSTNEEMPKIPDVTALGCLMYIMVCTRPDIARSVGVVSKYIANSGKEHWNTVNWVPRYLKGTKDLRIVF